MYLKINILNSAQNLFQFGPFLLFYPRHRQLIFPCAITIKSHVSVYIARPIKICNCSFRTSSKTSLNLYPTKLQRAFSVIMKISHDDITYDPPSGKASDWTFDNAQDIDSEQLNTQGAFPTDLRHEHKSRSLIKVRL